MCLSICAPMYEPVSLLCLLVISGSVDAFAPSLHAAHSLSPPGPGADWLEDVHVPVILGYSQALCPRPPDYPPRMHVVGSLSAPTDPMAPAAADLPLPMAVRAFLQPDAVEGGRRVVAFCFGSMLALPDKPGRAGALLDACVAAAARLGCTAIVCYKGQESWMNARRSRAAAAAGGGAVTATAGVDNGSARRGKTTAAEEPARTDDDDHLKDNQPEYSDEQSASSPSGGKTVVAEGEAHCMDEDAAGTLLLDSEPNVLWFRELPYVNLLPFVDAVVCHAGAGTVHTALAAGRPILTVPFDPDKSSGKRGGRRERGVGSEKTELGKAEGCRNERDGGSGVLGWTGKRAGKEESEAKEGLVVKLAKTELGEGMGWGRRKC